MSNLVIIFALELFASDLAGVAVGSLGIAFLYGKVRRMAGEGRERANLLFTPINDGIY